MPDSSETPYRTPAKPPSSDVPPPRPPSMGLFVATAILLAVAIIIVPVNFWVFINSVPGGDRVFKTLAISQLVAGIASLACGVAYSLKRDHSRGRRIGSVVMGFLGFVVGLGGPLGMALAESLKHMDFSGGAWGRPLRVRGRILHPRLRAGSDWTRGARPDVRGLDEPTRAALEALWLHDAQKEHASVPAFARISWLLAAVGAPAELMEAAHRAALEEIDHARRCFALAGGYGMRSHAVEPMPDLLVGALDVRGDPLARLATESLTDGCLLEDFNADVAAACEEACLDPAVKDVLARIAREERSHASFSWDLLEWIVARGDGRVRHAVVKAAGTLSGVPRPTAVPVAKASLVAHADPAAMLRHGRIPDYAWAKLWGARVSETRRRVGALLAARGAYPRPVVVSAGGPEVTSVSSDVSSDMTDCVRM